MPFKKGHARLPGAGRVKGKPNGTTLEVKRALQMAFDGIGGVRNLIKWAKKKPDLFYTKLYIRLLPHNIKLDASDVLTEQMQTVREMLGVVKDSELKEMHKILQRAGERHARQQRKEAAATSTRPSSSSLH